MEDQFKIGVDKKISVIIPVYNTEDMLHKCISSVLKQIYHNLQIILIDDGSTDKSAWICEQFAHTDHRIEVYHTENKGLVAARKLGLKMSVGDYIGFVDSDDYIEPNMFLELLKMLVESNADFIHSGYYIEEAEKEKKIVCNFGNCVIELKSTENKIDFLKKYILEEEKGSVLPNIWSKLFKAEFIKKCYKYVPDEQQYGEDFICLLRCIQESKKIILYKKAMYHYQVRVKSLSHLDYDEYLLKEVRLWHCLMAVLEDYQNFRMLQTSMFFFLKRRMIHMIFRTGCWKQNIPQFYFKDIELLEEKRIVIFGAGKVGRDYYVQISKYEKCNIIAWIDSNWNNYHFENVNIISVESINEMSFDLIIIAVNSEEVGKEMGEKLIKLGVAEKKVLWKQPGKYF